jgi:YHS domain-containing protein
MKLLDRHLERHRLLASLTVCAALCAASSGAFAVDRGAPGGIWKAVVPPKAMHGEFANEDPVGLAAGKHIKTDCSMNWVSGDDGKLYCFTTGTSLVFFEEAPQSYIRAARKFYEFDRPKTR